MREKLGFGPEDIERFAFCEGSPPELMGHKLTKAMQFAKQAASMGTQGNTQQSVMFVQLSKPFDVQKLTKLLGNGGRVKYQNKEYVQFEAIPIFSKLEMAAAHFIDEKTMILGTVSTVKSLMDGNGESGDVPELAAIDARQQVVFATIPKNVASGLPPGFLPVGNMRAMNPFSMFGNSFKLVGAALNFGEDMKFKFVTDYHSEEEARKAHDAIAGLLNPKEKTDKKEKKEPKEGEKEELDEMMEDDEELMAGGAGGMPVLPFAPQNVAMEMQKNRTISLNGGKVEAETSVGAAGLGEFKKMLTHAVAMAAVGEFSDMFDSNINDVIANLPDEGDPVVDDEMAGKKEGEEGGEAMAADNGGDENGEMPEAADPDAAVAKGEGKAEAGPGIEKHKLKDPKAVIALLEQKGCTVTPQGDVYLVLVQNRGFSNSDMVLIGALRKVKSLNIDESSVTDRGLIPLANCGKYLDTLQLRGADLTNDGIKHLTRKHLPVLRMLLLMDNTKLDDGCVEHLLDMFGIEVLNVRNTRISLEACDKLRQELECNVTKK
ncbi:MAG: hypothetical protein AB7O26_16230, partial [Planctomycetaceae bacterium]